MLPCSCSSCPQAAAEQVTAMRNELQLLNAKLAARDKQLLKHVQVGHGAYHWTKLGPVWCIRVYALCSTC